MEANILFSAQKTNCEKKSFTFYIEMSLNIVKCVFSLSSWVHLVVFDIESILAPAAFRVKITVGPWGFQESCHLLASLFQPLWYVKRPCAGMLNYTDIKRCHHENMKASASLMLQSKPPEIKIKNIETKWKNKNLQIPSISECQIFRGKIQSGI